MRLIPAIFAISVAFAQTDQFEVASIRPSAPAGTSDHVDIGVHIDGQQLRCTYLSIKDYIGAAYKLKNYQIIGQDWIAGDRFDISAKLPAGGTMAEVPDMIKGLLADRFKMTFHMDKKDFPVYALVVTKGGLKAPHSPDDGTPAEPQKAVNVSGEGGRGGVHINLGNGSFFTLADNKFIARKITMANLAETLARFEDKPVVDMTGAEGLYDIDLSFTEEDYRALLIRSAIAAGVTLPPEALRAMEGASGDSMAMALDKLGLKLESRKAPIDVMMVDHVSKMPTDN